MPIFTRLFTTEEYGNYNLYTSWVMLFGLLITLNLQQEVFNKGLVDHDRERPAYSTSQAALITVLTLGFFVVYRLFREPINSLTGMSTLLTSLMFLEIYVTSITSLWYARRRFDYAYKPLIAVTLGISVASVALGVAMVSLAPQGWRLVARVVSNIAPFLVAAICILVSFIKESRKVCEINWWMPSVRMGLPLIPHYASQVLLNQADKILIGWFLGSAYVALYGVAHSAGLLLVMVNNGINASFVPWLYGKLRSGDCDSVASVSNALVMITILLVFFLMLLAPECVAVLATDDYSEAVWCIPPIATGVVFSFMYTLFVNVEIYYGKAGYVAMASIASAAINVLLNIIVIPVFGYIASAYVTAVCYLATAVLHYVFMVRTLRNSSINYRIYDAQFLLLSVVGIAACAAASLMLYSMGPIRYVVMIAFLVLAVVFRKKVISSLMTIHIE